MLSIVSVLCAQSRSVYNELSGVEVFDAHRDALTFAGGSPVVAHPPCRLFGRLRHYVKDTDTDTEKFLGIFCADQVRRNGGVLEHPANSSLWREADLPPPGQSQGEGFTLALPQWWFGHRSDKLTWFYFAGIDRADIPEIPFRLDDSTRRPVENLSKRQREATPRDLAEWLVECARRTCPVTV
jgi:hypothetical protein